jgi:hypothetical protein
MGLGEDIVGLLSRIQDWSGNLGQQSGRFIAVNTTPQAGMSLGGELLGGPQQPQPITQGPLQGLTPMNQVRQMARYPASFASLVSSPFSAVMSAGRPTKAFHGSSEGFREFSMKKADPDALYGPGLYFTENPEVASSYAKTKGVGGAPNVHQSYLDITNPFVIDKLYQEADLEPLVQKLVQISKTSADKPVQNSALWAADMLANAGPLDGKMIYRTLNNAFYSKASVNRILQDIGYDGITHFGGANTGTPAHRVWIAFDPKQAVPTYLPPEKLP